MKIINGFKGAVQMESLNIQKIDRKEGGIRQKDPVIAEHCMEVEVDGLPPYALVCSPGNLVQLVIGNLYTEGLIGGVGDVKQIVVDEAGERAVVTLETTSQQGESVVSGTRRIMNALEEISWSPEEIFFHAQDFFKGSDLFGKTGGVHSCMLTLNGNILYRCEDMGRHNALDKVIGYALLNNVKLEGTVLYTSGRVPADMAVKIIRSRVPVAASHSAVTVNAVRLAETYGLTLLGFVRDQKFNLYAGVLPLERV